MVTSVIVSLPVDVVRRRRLAPRSSGPLAGLVGLVGLIRLARLRRYCMGSSRSLCITGPTQKMGCGPREPCELCWGMLPSGPCKLSAEVASVCLIAGGVDTVGNLIKPSKGATVVPKQSPCPGRAACRLPHLAWLAHSVTSPRKLMPHPGRLESP